MESLVKLPVDQYISQLSTKVPAPGGGSAAALVGALGASLIAMSASYSLGKGRTKLINKRLDSIHLKAQRNYKALTELIDLDAKAYQALVDSKNADAQTKRRAKQQAKKVPKDIAKYCKRSVDLLPYLIKNGNQNLLSDMHAAGEMLLAAYNSAMIMVEANS